MLIIAFFIVFFIGVYTCFYQAAKAFTTYRNPIHTKHSHLLIATSSILLGCTALGGLIQATLSAGVL